MSLYRLRKKEIISETNWSKLAGDVFAFGDSAPELFDSMSRVFFYSLF